MPGLVAYPAGQERSGGRARSSRRPPVGAQLVGDLLAIGLRDVDVGKHLLDGVAPFEPERELIPLAGRRLGLRNGFGGLFLEAGEVGRRQRRGRFGARQGDRELRQGRLRQGEGRQGRGWQCRWPQVCRFSGGAGTLQSDLRRRNLRWRDLARRALRSVARRFHRGGWKLELGDVGAGSVGKYPRTAGEDDGTDGKKDGPEGRKSQAFRAFRPVRRRGGIRHDH